MKDKNKKHPAAEGEGLEPDAREAGAEAHAKHEPAANGATPDGKKAEKSHDKHSDEKYLRLLADFDNFRKRSAREKMDARQNASEDFLSEMLPVLDHMELTWEAATAAKADQKIIEGFRMVVEQLKAVVAKFGLRDIETKVGQAFDPDRQEAVSLIPSESAPENTVMAQVRRGYLLGDRVLRPARVVISGGPAEQAPAKAEEVPPVENAEAPAEDAE